MESQEQSVSREDDIPSSAKRVEKAKSGRKRPLPRALLTLDALVDPKIGIAKVVNTLRHVHFDTTSLFNKMLFLCLFYDLFNLYKQERNLCRKGTLICCLTTILFGHNLLFHS